MSVTEGLQSVPNNQTLPNPVTATVVAILLGVSAAQAQTVLNPGADLQTEINNAAPGSSLLLNPGTYSPAAALSITKALTIQNNQAGTVTIQVPAAAVNAVHVAASNVTLAGLTISGTPWGIYAGDGNSPPQQFTNDVFRGLTINGAGGSGHGIYIRNVTNAVVDSCIVSNMQADGIYLAAGSTGGLVMNNTVNNAHADGIVIQDSNSALVAGNTVVSAGVDGIIFTGSSFGRIERNTITNPGVDGITLTNDSVAGLLSTGNYVGRNTATASHPFPGAGIWLNSQSNATLVYGNTTSGFPENGFDLFNSSYSEFRGNTTSSDAQGGIFFYTNPTSSGPTPTNNVIDGNYVFNLPPVNAGINLQQANNNMVYRNFIQGPATPNNAGGIMLQSTNGNSVFENLFTSLAFGTYVFSTATGSSYYLNRQLSSMPNTAISPAGITFDAGAALGGNFWAGHNNTSPYTNIFYDTAGHFNGPYADNHPFATDSLGQSPSITSVLPSAGSVAAVGTGKTIEWRSTGCSYVDIQYNSAESGLQLIASNYPDVGYYPWTVPGVAPATDYSIVLTCKNGSQLSTGVSATGPSFTIAKAGLELLSPQGNLRLSQGSSTVVAWAKTGNVGAVSVLFRASPGGFTVTLASNVSADYATVTVPSGATAEAGFLIQESGGSADSTDGFANVMGSSPLVSGPTGTLSVGTLQHIEWASIAGSQYVDVDFISPQAGTINLIQSLPDFGRFDFLVPAAIGSGASIRVTFKSTPSTTITTGSSNTFTVAAAAGTGNPPTAISVSPPTGSGQTQTFAASYSDSSGASAITAAYILVGSTTTSAGSCLIQFNAGSNTYQLASDAGTAWSAPVSVGSGSASNSQCTLSGAGAGATPSGNNLTVNFPVTFAAGYAGAQNIYLNVIDGGGLSSGWQQLGTFTVTSGGGGGSSGPVPVCNAQGFPCVVSLTPTNGSGSSSTFTGVFTHSGGATQHYLGYILFLPTPNIVWYTATGSCLVEYNRISNAMRLINDAGTNWLPGVIGLPVGRVGSLTNSHCTLNVGQSSATINGTIMTVNAAVTFNSSFTGRLATFMQGFDVTGAYTGMTQFGNWEVSAGVQKPGPYIVNMTPTSGAGSSATLTFTAGHTSGVSSLSFVTILISSVIVGAPACQAFYFPASNTLNLVNDSGSAMVSTNGIAPGTAGTLANSRCSINTGSASSSPAGNNVTVALPMTFDSSTFGGAKNIYLNAFDDFGKLSHWVNSATWTVQ